MTAIAAARAATNTPWRGSSAAFGPGESNSFQAAIARQPRLP